MKWRSWNHQYKEMGFASQRLYPNEELLRFMGSTLFQRSPKGRGKTRVLEVGCGSGANLWMIAREGFDAYGIDISPEALKLCRKMLARWGTNATMALGCFLEIPFPDNYFDAVVDVVSMQHIKFSDHVSAYREVWRVLKRRGVFFSCHLGNKSYSYWNGGGKRIDRFTLDNIANIHAPLVNNGMTCFPTERAVAGSLAKAGFLDIAIESVMKSYDERTKSIQYLVIKGGKGK